MLLERHLDSHSGRQRASCGATGSAYVGAILRILVLGPLLSQSIVNQDAGGGSISDDGHYTAPSRPGTYRILATAVADPSVTAQASITVENP